MNVRALVKNESLIIKQQCFTMKLIRAVASRGAVGIFKNYLIDDSIFYIKKEANLELCNKFTSL